MLVDTHLYSCHELHEMSTMFMMPLEDATSHPADHGYISRIRTWLNDFRRILNDFDE